MSSFEKDARHPERHEERQPVGGHLKRVGLVSETQRKKKGDASEAKRPKGRQEG